MSAVSNILAWRETASAADVEAGRSWYPFARKMATEYALAYGVSTEVASGVIAVLSPRAEWDVNLRVAETVLRAHANGAPMPRPEDCEGVYGRNVRKAWAIAQHGDGFPRCDGTREGSRGRVTCQAGPHACPAANYLHGPKVHEFFETIAGRETGCTIDVWATRAADVSPYDVLTLARDDPRRVGVPGARFATLQAAYIEAAATIGETPRETQAIVWHRIRRTWRRAPMQTELAIPF